MRADTFVSSDHSQNSLEDLDPDAKSSTKNPQNTYKNRSGLAKIKSQAVKQQKSETYWLLNKWEGQIDTIKEETFSATMYDLNDGNIVETFEFLISDISAVDKQFLRSGSVFYWYIGYRDLSTGQRKRESLFWFRRGGSMTPAEFEKSRQSVEDIWNAIGAK